MGWQTMVAKGALKRCIPFMPQLRRLKRKLSGSTPEVANLWSTIHHAKVIFRELSAAGGTVASARVLEIGTGWYPVIPMLMRLKGAKSVILTDIQPFLDPVSFESARQFLLQNLDKISSELDLPVQEARAALNSFTDLEQAGFTYHCPFDPATLPDASLDIIYSRTVLEHIPPQVLVTLFKALAPKMAPHAVMAHHVDESDHLEHNDKSISRVHFLTLGDTAWRFINAAWDYQNRLRHHEFLPLFEQSGYDVLKAYEWADPRVLNILPSLKLVAPYNRMTAEQIAVMESVFVLRPRQKVAEG
jgi:hypothetical protein